MQEKDVEIQQLKAASRDVTQVQMQLHEEILLKEGYAHQVSEAQVSLSKEKMKFKEELKVKEDSFRQSGECISEVETLLQQTRSYIAAAANYSRWRGQNPHFGESSGH